jgi:hypothetical protein
MGKRIKKSQLRAIAIKRQWAKLWRHDPIRMEAARKVACETNAELWRMRNRNLRAVVASWPDQMTPQEFATLCIKLLDGASFDTQIRMTKPDSVRRRLATKGMVRFDPASGKWINLCRLQNP